MFSKALSSNHFPLKVRAEVKQLSFPGSKGEGRWRTRLQLHPRGHRQTPVWSQGRCMCVQALPAHTGVCESCRLLLMFVTDYICSVILKNSLEEVHESTCGCSQSSRVKKSSAWTGSAGLPSANSHSSELKLLEWEETCHKEVQLTLSTR